MRYSEGPQPADIMLVGETPGETEVRRGRPFVGRAGWFLDSCLSKAGIQRDSIRITNLFHERPPGNEIGRFLTYAQETPIPLTQRGPEGSAPKTRYVPAARWDAVEALQEEIRQTRPRVLVCCGNVVPRLFMADKNLITEIRGSFYQADPTRTDYQGVVAPIVHPAAVIRTGSGAARALSIFDWMRIKRVAENPDIILERSHDFVSFPTFEELMEELHRLLAEAEYLSYDLETGHHSSLLCMALSGAPDSAVCFPYIYRGKRSFSNQQNYEVFQLIQRIFRKPGLKLVGQNLQYDNVVMQKYLGMRFGPIWLDTMLGFHELHPELPKGLDTIASVATWQPFYKDQRKSWKRVSDWELLYEYNCRDAAVTLEAALNLEPQIRRRGIWDIVQAQQNLIEPLTAMQFKGMKVDLDARDKASEALNEDLTAIEAKITEMAGRPVNIGSHKDCTKLFFEELGFKPTKRSKKTGKPSVDKKVLLKLSVTAPVARRIVEARSVAKLISTYVSVAVDPDGRVRPMFDAAGTETGRLSSRQNYFGSGLNMQNIAKHSYRAKTYIRRMYVADPGKLLVEVDLSQAEARVVAYLTNDAPMIEAYNRGMDVHSMRASLFTGVPYEDFVDRYKGGDKTTNEIRDLAKKGTHGVNYGMGYFILQETLASGGPGGEGGIYKTVAECKEFIAAIHRANPGLAIWHQEVQKQLAATRTLVTPLGRKRTFWGPLGPTLYKDAYACVPQSTVGHLGTILVQRIYDKHGHEVDLLANVHDSVLLQCDEADVDRIVPSCVKLAEVPLLIRGKPLVIPAEAEVGPNWRDMEEYNGNRRSAH